MRKTTSKAVALLIILVMISATIVCAAPGGNSDSAFDRKVLARIDADKALEHIRYLSEAIGPRVAGTEGERQAAEYIKGVFEEYGYEPELQPFEYMDVESHLIVEGTEIFGNAATEAGFQGYTDEAGVSGTIVPCGIGLPEQIPESVAGKIALIQRGTINFATKAHNAEEKGAVGVILYNNQPGSLIPQIFDFEVHIPVMMITRTDGEALLQKVLNREVLVDRFSIVQKVMESQNVVAVRTPKANKPNSGIVYVTAHYDSVAGAPGASDNASGTATMLEFAKILKAYPIDKEIRFIACGAEEVGLQGSYYYVGQLAEEELGRSAANFNMDMIATSYESCSILYTDTVTGEPNLVVEAAEAAGARLGNNITALNEGSSSDHAPFDEVGIPAACFIYGDEEGNLEPYYHEPEDTIEINISLDRLQEAGEIIGAALYDVLRVDTPNLERSSIRDTYKGVKGFVSEE